MPCKISLSDIDKMSADFDNLIQQERKTDVIATTALREYAKSKLDESYKQEKSKIYGRPISIPNNLGFFNHMYYCWKQQDIALSQLESLLEESKIRISKLNVEYVFEALRINYTSGFIAAREYILNQPITIIPKPYSEMPKNNSIL